MARAKDEIRESIINQLPAEWNLTDSDAALWKAFVNAITSAIYIFELIMDSFKADIEQKIDAKRIGSKDWYIQKVKEFQVDSQYNFSMTARLVMLR